MSHGHDIPHSNLLLSCLLTVLTWVPIESIDHTANLILTAIKIGSGSIVIYTAFKPTAIKHIKSLQSLFTTKTQKKK